MYQVKRLKMYTCDMFLKSRDVAQGLLCRHANRLEPSEFIKHLESGLGDHTDNKLVCHSMLERLARNSPNAVLVHLDALVVPLRKTLDIRIKSDAVKQEVLATSSRNEALSHS